MARARRERARAKRCPHCGAPGAPHPDHGSWTCTYCQTLVETRKPRATGPFAFFADEDGDGTPDFVQGMLEMGDGVTGSVRSEVRTKYVVNGEEYASLDEMPAAVRSLFADEESPRSWTPERARQWEASHERSWTSTRSETFEPRDVAARPNRPWLWPFLIGVAVAYFLLRLLA